MVNAPLILAFLFFSISLIIHQTTADPTDIVTRNCTHKKFRNGITFLQNYRKVTEMMENEMQHQRYGYMSAGERPWQVFVLAHCHGDLSQAQCNECYAASRDSIPGCMPHMGGRIYLDGCFLRAQNYDFLFEALSPEDTKICGDIGEDEDAPRNFESMAKDVINNVVKKAVVNNGFGVGSKVLSDMSIYVLANCWKTLEMEACSTCLNNASTTVFECLHATEGRALNAGCIIHYSDENFISNFNKISSQMEKPEANIEKYGTIFLFIKYAVTIIMITIVAICTGIFFGRIINNHKTRQHLKLRGIESFSRSLFRKSPRFKYSTLARATDHFSESHKLGQGGFGEVFKGSLPDGREIAVKRLFVSSMHRSQEVYNEVNVINRADHKNLVRFLGCCLTSHDSLLVYEFLTNRSLDRILFDPERKKELDWKKRLEIIIGTAEGLQYLHNECEVRIVHRDVKASNILLDFKYRPKIADFGLAKFFEIDNTSDAIAIAGTFGYIAPEYMARGQLTEKVDVYSYGVLVLEIVSGVQNNKFNADESLETLVTWTWKHFWTNTVAEIIDESLEVDDTEEVIRVAQIGLLCTQEVASLRPTMSEIIEMLTNKDVQLAEPSKPPFLDESNSSSLGLNELS